MSTAFGSFADELRHAIDRRGLSLERIREHLQQRGTTISVATLSYWQSGRSLPGRKASLEALAHLEDVLEIEPGRLRRTLPQTRERSRRCDVPELDVLWPEQPQADVLGRLDTRWDTELDRVSLHDSARIGPDRRQTTLSVRQVLRARSDGPDRRAVLHCQDDVSVELPQVRAVRGCRVGRVEQDRGHGVIGAELIFFTPLRRGDTVIIDYDLQYGTPGPLELDLHRRIRLPMREYVLEVEFDPAALPESIVSYRDDWETPLELDQTHRSHLVRTDLSRNAHGMRWAWPTS